MLTETRPESTDEWRAARDILADEIRAALRAAGPLTTPELYEHCPSAADTSAVSRVVHLLRTFGEVVIDGKRHNGATGRGQQMVSVYRLAGSDSVTEAAPDAAPETGEAVPKAPPAVSDGVPRPKRAPRAAARKPPRPKPPAAAKPSRRISNDAPEVQAPPVAYLAVLADSLLLAIADHLLADDPVWQAATRLRDAIGTQTHT